MGVRNYDPAFSIVVSQHDSTAFAAITVDTIYFFQSSETHCIASGSFSVTNQTFTLVATIPSATSLVVNDTLIIGTATIPARPSGSVGVFAVNISTASFWWKVLFPVGVVQYANYPHFYDPIIRGGAFMLQTSVDGSSGTVTYFYSLDGVDQQAQIQSVDSPGYQLVVVNSTTVVQVSFSIIFFLVPTFRSGTVLVARQSGKLGFSSDLSCALFQVNPAQVYYFNGYLYATCIVQLFVVNAFNLAWHTASEPSGNILALSAFFPDTSDPANQFYLGTTSGVVYQVAMSSTAVLTRIFSDSTTALWGSGTSDVGLSFMSGYYPATSSVDLTPNKATPMLALGVRLLSITSNIYALNLAGLASARPILWQVALSNFRLTFPAAVDGLHFVLSSGAQLYSDTVVRSIPLQLHSTREFVESSNTTVGNTTSAPTRVGFFGFQPSPIPLGVAFDYDKQVMMIVAEDGGVYAVNQSVPHSPYRLCSAAPTNPSALVIQPTWVYYNRASGASSEATKALCYVDQQSRLSCYNTTSGDCSAVHQLQLCNGSSSLTPNRLLPLGGVGSGVVAMFCTGMTSTVGVNVIDVRSGTLRSFGSRSTCGVLGVIDDEEGGTLYVPQEWTGAAASADPAIKRFTIQKYWANASSETLPIWSSSTNVSIISNLALDSTFTITAAVDRAVHCLGIDAVSGANGTREYHLASFEVATGIATSGSTPPVIQLHNSALKCQETWFAISSRWIAIDSSIVATPQVFVYLITNSFFAIVNGTGVGNSVSVVLWIPTSSLGEKTVLPSAGFQFDVRRASPIVEHSLGVAVVLLSGDGGVLAFSTRNGSMLWQSPFNTSYPPTPPTAFTLLEQINATVVFSTQAGVAAVDMITGTRTLDLVYQSATTAVKYNGTFIWCAAVCGPTNVGMTEDYTKDYFVAMIYTSEGLMTGVPFFVQPNLTTDAMPLADSGTEAFYPWVQPVITVQRSGAQTTEHPSTTYSSASISGTPSLSVSFTEETMSAVSKSTTTSSSFGSKSARSSSVTESQTTTSSMSDTPSLSVSLTEETVSESAAESQTGHTSSVSVSPSGATMSTTGATRIHRLARSQTNMHRVVSKSVSSSSSAFCALNAFDLHLFQNLTNASSIQLVPQQPPSASPVALTVVSAPLSRQTINLNFPVVINFSVSLGGMGVGDSHNSSWVIRTVALDVWSSTDFAGTPLLTTVVMFTILSRAPPSLVTRTQFFSCLVQPPSSSQQWLPSSLSPLRSVTLVLRFAMDCPQDSMFTGNLVVQVPCPGQDQTLATQVKTAGIVAQFSTSIAGPAAGGAVGRLAVIRRLVVCSSEDAVVGGMLTLPIHSSCDDGGGGTSVASVDEAYGAIFGNLVLWSAACLLMLIVALLYSLLAKVAPIVAMEALGFPSPILSLIIVTVPSTVSATFVLLSLLSSSSSTCASNHIIMIAVVGIAMCVFPIGVLGVVSFIVPHRLVLTTATHHHLHSPSPSSRVGSRKFPCRAFTFLFERHARWIEGSAPPAATSSLEVFPRWRRVATVVLLEYTVLWYACADITVLTVAGALGSVSSLNSAVACRGGAIALLLLYTGQLILCAAVRPFTTYFSHAYTLITLALGTLTVACQVWYLYASDKADASLDSLNALLTASAACDLLVTGLSTFRTVLDGVELLQTFHRHTKVLRDGICTARFEDPVLLLSVVLPAIDDDASVLMQSFSSMPTIDVTELDTRDPMIILNDEEVVEKALSSTSSSSNSADSVRYSPLVRARTKEQWQPPMFCFGMQTEAL